MNVASKAVQRQRRQDRLNKLSKFKVVDEVLHSQFMCSSEDKVIEKLSFYMKVHIE